MVASRGETLGRNSRSIATLALRCEMQGRDSLGSSATLELRIQEIPANHGENAPLESFPTLGMQVDGAGTGEMDAISAPAPATADIQLKVTSRSDVRRNVDKMRRGGGLCGRLYETVDLGVRSSRCSWVWESIRHRFGLHPGNRQEVNRDRGYSSHVLNEIQYSLLDKGVVVGLPERRDVAVDHVRDGIPPSHFDDDGLRSEAPDV